MVRRRLPLLLPLLLGLLGAASAARQEARTTVAVLAFDNNTGDERYKHLGRALAAMMISDLSVVEEIRLVEREKIQEILAELQLQQSGYADPETAVNVGMIAGAQYVVTGAFATAEPEMRLDTRVASVETTEIVKTADVRGPSDQLFDLQQRLADELVDGLGLVLSEAEREELRAQQEANRIDDVETALAFSRSLCLLDAGYYVEAFELIQDVRRRAPASALVVATFELLQDRAKAEAGSRLKEEANKRLGGLFGRKRAPRRPQRPPSGC